MEVVFRGVIPMAMRGQSVPREKGLHTLRDVKREAVRLGMPFGRIHDPLGDGAMRCLLVAEHAVDVGRERDFVIEASHGIWAEAVDVASEAGLRLVCERAGLDWRACVSALEDPKMRWRVEENTEALARIGHWGVPVLVLDGELFWGQDRIEDLGDRAARKREAAMPVNPSAEQLEALGALAGAAEDGPLVMLNLNSYRERAAYAVDPPGGEPAEVSGIEAYQRYGMTALKVLARVGGGSSGQRTQR